MSTESADVHGKFLRGTQRHMAESPEHMEKEPARESSSSSSDGSNEPHPNPPNSDQDLNQSATSVLQRSRMSIEPSTENLAPYGTLQLQPAGNLHPICTLATSSQLFPPGGLVEPSPEAGVFQPLNSQQDMDISNQNQLSSSNICYHLPTPNLPSDFCLESSSSTRSLVPQIQPQQPQIPRTSGNGNNEYPFMSTQCSDRNAQPQINMHEHSSSTFGPQEFSFQGLLGSAIGSANFCPSGVTNALQLAIVPLQKKTELALPLQSDAITTNSNCKMIIPWQDNIPPASNFHPFQLSPLEQSILGQSYSVLNASTTWYFKNSVYDPMYEAIGLPIDPHLRMFMASREYGGH